MAYADTFGMLGLITIDRGAGQVLGMDIRTQRLDIRQAVGFLVMLAALLWRPQGLLGERA